MSSYSRADPKTLPCGMLSSISLNIIVSSLKLIVVTESGTSPSVAHILRHLNPADIYGAYFVRCTLILHSITYFDI